MTDIPPNPEADALEAEIQKDFIRFAVLETIGMLLAVGYWFFTGKSTVILIIGLSIVLSLSFLFLMIPIFLKQKKISRLRQGK